MQTNEKKRGRERNSKKLQLLGVLYPSKFNVCPQLKRSNATFSLQHSCVETQLITQTITGQAGDTANGFTLYGLLWSPSAATNALYWIIKSSAASNTTQSLSMFGPGFGTFNWNFNTLTNVLLPQQVSLSSISSVKARVYAGQLTLRSNTISTSNAMIDGSVVTSSVASQESFATDASWKSIPNISNPKKDGITVPLWKGVTMNTGGIFNEEFVMMNLNDKLYEAQEFGPITFVGTGSAQTRGIYNLDYVQPIANCVGIQAGMFRRPRIQLDHKGAAVSSQYIQIASMYAYYNSTVPGGGPTIVYTARCVPQWGTDWTEYIFTDLDMVSVGGIPIPSNSTWIATLWENWTAGATGATITTCSGVFLDRDFSCTKMCRIDGASSGGTVQIEGKIFSQMIPEGSTQNFSGLPYEDLGGNTMTAAEIEREFGTNPNLRSFYTKSEYTEMEEKLEE